MLLTLVLFALGLSLVLIGAHLLLKGGLRIAKQLNVSPSWIGFVVIAIGTSLPEFAVSIVASLQEQPSVVMGNILGSNAANLGLILGITALVQPIKTVGKRTMRYVHIMMLATIAIAILSLDEKLSRLDGIVLVTLGIWFFRTVWKEEASAPETRLNETRSSLRSYLLWIGGGVICLWGGGRILVDAAIDIARSLQVSPELISLSLIAIGTSIPELATSLMAAYKHKTSVALGNVLGSNATNIFFVLGLTLLLNPMTLTPVIKYYDLPIVMLITATSSWLLLRGRSITKKQGILLIIIYLMCLLVSTWLHAK